MNLRQTLACPALPCRLLLWLRRRPTSYADVRSDPAAVRLTGPGDRYSLLLHGKTATGRLVDLTRAARYHSLNTKVATVTPTGVVQGRTDGTTAIQVNVVGRTLTVAVSVKDVAAPRRFNFENDIVPLLSRFGCNSSGCHGKAEGQNGFKLSVFGFDPAADYSALVKESRGRRVFPAVPTQSLLLRKVSGQAAHGGGIRIPADSREYETLRAWIAAGMPFGEAGDPTVTAVRVEPRERVLDVRGRQQLRVIARYSDGREVDVTGHARFQSNNDGLAAVAVDGLVSAGEAPGEVAVMASFMNHVDTFRVSSPGHKPSRTTRACRRTTFSTGSSSPGCGA